MKTIFTRVEQFLIRNNRSFILNRHSERHVETSSEHSDYLKEIKNDLQFRQPYLTRLLSESIVRQRLGSNNEQEEVQHVEGKFRNRRN